MLMSLSRWLPLLLLGPTLLGGAMLLLSGAVSAGPPDHANGGGGGGGSGDGTTLRFAVVDLGGPSAGALAMNDQAEIVGRLDNRASYWRVDEQGVFAAPLPEIDGIVSEALDINSSGQAVGVEEYPDGDASFQIAVKNALYWQISESGEATVRELPSPLVGTFLQTEATAISDTGVMVGHSAAYDDDGNLIAARVLVWQIDAQDQVQVFELEDGALYGAYDVNNFGEVVGEEWRTEAVLWQLTFDESGLVVDASAGIGLGTLDFPHSAALAINDAGDVAGRVYEDMDSQNSESRAVLWHLDESGQVVDTMEIPHVSGQKHWSSAWKVNADASQAIGASSELFRITFKPKVYVPSNSEPFLWHEGQTHALNGLITDFDGLTELISAVDLNASGEICGVAWKGEQRHAYLAVPLP
jgi:hypothetical protein